MEHIKENGIYGVDDVWRFYSVEEALKHKTTCANWPHVVEDLKKLIGKTWVDKKDIRYLVNSVPVYREYKVIGIEDNQAWADYYWILEDAKGKRKYELANYADFYKDIRN